MTDTKTIPTQLRDGQAISIGGYRFWVSTLVGSYVRSTPYDTYTEYEERMLDMGVQHAMLSAIPDSKEVEMLDIIENLELVRIEGRTYEILQIEDRQAFLGRPTK